MKGHLWEHAASGRDALLFRATGDGNPHVAPATRYEVYYPAGEAAGRKDLRWHEHDLRHGPPPPDR